MSFFRILADENISPGLADFLRRSGLDVKEVLKEGWQGKTDEFLLKKALNEERFIITHDSDFGNLAIKEGKKCFGVIFLRTASVKPSDVIEILRKFLRLNLEVSPGTFIVIDSKKVRIRHPEVSPGPSKPIRHNLFEPATKYRPGKKKPPRQKS